MVQSVRVAVPSLCSVFWNLHKSIRFPCVWRLLLLITSLYNSVERCWGILEQHWNGSLLDSVDAVVQFAQTMNWKGKPPAVQLVTTTYPTGVKLTSKAMKVVEAQLQRLPAACENGLWTSPLLSLLGGTVNSS
jgi:hypothetical protein